MGERKIEMTDTELTIAVVEAAGGRYFVDHVDSEVLAINGYYVDAGNLRELVHEHIFPVIQERGKWGEFVGKLWGEFIGTEPENDGIYPEHREWDEFIIKFVLSLSSRTLAEFSLVVLGSELKPGPR